MFWLAQMSYGQTRSELENSLSELSEWKYTDETDIWNILVHTSELLTSCIESGVINGSDSLGNLEVTQSADGLLKVYTFAYHSGGTRGSVNNSVIQFIKSDGSYEIVGSGKEMSFYQIEKLPSSNDGLYLLLGVEKCSSRMYQSLAWVIDVSSDSINTNYNGFQGGFSSVSYYDDVYSGDHSCIACMDYDINRNELVFGEMGEDDFMEGYLTEKALLDKRSYKNLEFDAELKQFRIKHF